MQQEILARGPLVCGIACPDDFTYHYHSSKRNGEGGGLGSEGLKQKLSSRKAFRTAAALNFCVSVVLNAQSASK